MQREQTLESLRQIREAGDVLGDRRGVRQFHAQLVFTEDQFQNGVFRQWLVTTLTEQRLDQQPLAALPGIMLQATQRREITDRTVVAHRWPHRVRSEFAR